MTDEKRKPITKASLDSDGRILDLQAFMEELTAEGRYWLFQVEHVDWIPILHRMADHYFPERLEDRDEDMPSFDKSGPLCGMVIKMGERFPLYFMRKDRITAAEVAERLGVDVELVYKWKVLTLGPIENPEVEMNLPAPTVTGYGTA